MAGWVLGCHRSGTSLVAGILREASSINHRLTIGEDIPYTLDNPGGHCESLALMGVNEQLLMLAGCSWHRPFLARPDWESPQSLQKLQIFRENLALHISNDHWIDKDPRLCLTRDALAHVMLRDQPALAVLRHPLSVAESLFQRDGFTLRKSLALWIIYNYHLYNGTSRQPLATILFRDLFSSDTSILDAVSRRLRIFLLQAIDGDTISAGEMRSVLCKHVQHRHHRNKSEDVSTAEQDILSLVNHLWESILLDVNENEGKELPILFRSAVSDFCPYISNDIMPPLYGLQIQNMQMSIDELRGQLANAHRTMRVSIREVETIHATTSWKVTAPIRALSSLLKRIL